MLTLYWGMVLCIFFRFKDFFGLRDFIHMIHYLRRGKTSSITPQLVMAALERNFNGCEEFNAVCEQFIRHVSGTASHGETFSDRTGCVYILVSLEHTVRLPVIVDM